MLLRDLWDLAALHQDTEILVPWSWGLELPGSTGLSLIVKAGSCIKSEAASSKYFPWVLGRQPPESGEV